MLLAHPVDSRLQGGIQQLHDHDEQAGSQEESPFNTVAAQPKSQGQQEDEKDCFLAKGGLVSPGGSDSFQRAVKRQCQAP
ncbi:MAG: hypothetical protein Kow0089_24690 [Desulfobulbaceae bacterium]